MITKLDIVFFHIRFLYLLFRMSRSRHRSQAIVRHYASHSTAWQYDVRSFKLHKNSWFNSWPFYFHVTTLAKLFTYVPLSGLAPMPVCSEPFFLHIYAHFLMPNSQRDHAHCDQQTTKIQQQEMVYGETPSGMSSRENFAVAITSDLLSSKCNQFISVPSAPKL